MGLRKGTRFTRRAAGMTFAALAGGVVAAACGAESSGGGSKSTVGQSEAKWSGTQDLEIWVTGYEPVKQAYKVLSEKFNAEHNNIKVTNQVPKYGRMSDIVPAKAGGMSPHVVETNQPNSWPFAGNGIMVPLNNFYKRDKTTADAVSDFYPGILESVTWRDELHYFVTGVSMEVWHTNSDFFKRAGIEQPKSGWTWNDLENSVGPALKGAVGEDGSPLMCELNEMYRMMHWVLQNGGGMTDKTGTKLTISAPEFIEAVEFVRKLVLAEIIREKNPKKAKAGPGRGGREGVIGSKYTHGQNYRLERGDVALELEGMTRIPRYRKSLGDLMGVSPAIKGPKRQAALFDSWEIGVVSNDEPAAVEAGYAFAAWMIRPENLIVYEMARANLPPRKALTELSNASDLWKAEPLIKDAMEYLNYADTFPFTPATGPMRKGINSVLANITRFGDPAAQTLTELEKVLMAQHGNLLQ